MATVDEDAESYDESESKMSVDLDVPLYYSAAPRSIFENCS